LWSALTVNSAGVDVLAAPDLPNSEGIDSTRLHEVIEYARLLYDWVILDAPCVFHRVSLLSVSEADQTYLISTSDLASLHLARKAVNMLTQLGFGKDRYQIVVNRLSRRDGIGGSDLEKIFNCQVHASIPNDYFALHRVISLGQPLSPDCDLGKAIAGLAAKISGGAAADKRTASGVVEPRPALSQT
jgi:pilus assembly protein CpaE